MRYLIADEVEARECDLEATLGTLSNLAADVDEFIRDWLFERDHGVVDAGFAQSHPNVLEGAIVGIPGIVEFRLAVVPEEEQGRGYEIIKGGEAVAFVDTEQNVTFYDSE